MSLRKFGRGEILPDTTKKTASKPSQADLAEIAKEGDEQRTAERPAD
jgi:hypothetical protein